jgi:hypothetical protein
MTSATMPTISGVSFVLPLISIRRPIGSTPGK